MAKKKNRNSAVNMPNVTRPLFVYGVFKPNQVGFELIRKYIDTITPVTVKGILKHRNGIPILFYNPKKDGEYTDIDGFLYTFNTSNKKPSETDGYKAYELVSNSRKCSLFEWSNIKIDERECNVLVGKDPTLADYYDRRLINNYDGSTEICFTEEDIDYVKSLIEQLNPEDASHESIFQHEMVYMLIWSFIDKFLSLSYGGHNQSGHVKKLSERKDFKEALNRTPVEYGRVAHNTRTNETATLNPDNSENTIWYYYLIRCNIIHGGKYNSPSVRKQLKALKKSSLELITILGYLFDFNFGRRSIYEDDDF